VLTEAEYRQRKAEIAEYDDAVKALAEAEQLRQQLLAAIEAVGQSHDRVVSVTRRRLTPVVNIDVEGQAAAAAVLSLLFGRQEAWVATLRARLDPTIPPEGV
jgi:hypothetical protein